MRLTYGRLTAMHISTIRISREFLERHRIHFAHGARLLVIQVRRVPSLLTVGRTSSSPEVSGMSLPRWHQFPLFPITGPDHLGRPRVHER